MQVAKYWRKNQLRYRLHGLVQQKVEMDAETNPVKVSEHPMQKVSEASSKSKVA